MTIAAMKPQTETFQRTGLPSKAYNLQYPKTLPQRKLEQVNSYPKDLAQIQI